MPAQQADERTRLLRHNSPINSRNERASNGRPNGNTNRNSDDDDEDDAELVQFEEGDNENPRNWSLFWKYIQVFLVFIVGLILPMASSIWSPGISEIASDYNTNNQLVTGSQTGFVCMLGIGPLFFAPMSETFGRRIVFLVNLTLFTLFQIPTALAPNIETFVVMRTLGGLFGSVGVANGGGSISDMFETHERATVLGFYLLGPLLGPTLGPFLGGIILARFHWRWVFGFTCVISAVVTFTCFFLLHETCAPIILEQRKKKLQNENEGKSFKVEGQSDMGLMQKIGGNSTRATKILFQQPIVLVMSAYQALVFSTMYSLYTDYSKIWSSPPYNFSKSQVGLSYLAPATGFVLTACIIVPFIDRVYNRLAQTHNNGKGKPEYRLPLANIGAVFLPVSLFWFSWTVEYGKPWPVALSAMLLFGASQVSIFNCVQNYYIDAFESMAASALAAGAFLRSIVGGVVPLFTPMLIEQVGYGWGLSVFGIVATVLMPAPLLFFRYGARLRERFAVNL
ncbi:hypothetical protein PMZ80_007164 [Knufia obscura]|uniref:Major facilitator superfamily (MFS) profile domain-containing protein n=1 Tax=Knufia obscura TaxID=1635080 RepID=A0ABR0RK84_9EURO|nr:hypothetical protein PMZ80_007164 [Knufia obscura]